MRVYLLLLSMVALFSCALTPPAASSDLAAVDVAFLAESWSRAPFGTALPPSRLDEALVPRSAITAMPEWRPERVTPFVDLGVSAVMWGDDPVFGASASQTLSFYRGGGISVVAGNLFLLSAGAHWIHDHPEYRNAVCFDIAGHRLVPSWLSDDTYQAEKSYWGCTNNPLYREFQFNKVDQMIAAGVSMLHIDDHSGTYAATLGSDGCFCSYCQAGFRLWLKTRSGLTPAQLGLVDFDTFDYGNYLRSKGYGTLERFRAAVWSATLPLRTQFLAFQRDSAAAFVADLGRRAQDDAGHPVAVGVNAYNLGPETLFDAPSADYYANEVEHWGVEDSVPPLAYSLATALGRRAFVTADGESWIRFGQTHSVNRVRTWIAQAYAFGQSFMYAWKKWGYSAATGTVWTIVEPEVFAPMTSFVRQHPQLFDGTRALARVAVFYDNEAAARGRGPVRDVVTTLLNAGVPFRLVTTREDPLPLIVPDDGRWALGRAAIQRDPSRITVESGRVWALPRAAPGRPLILHLLNKDYDAKTDQMFKHKNVVVRFEQGLAPDLGASPTFWYHTPGVDSGLVSASLSDGRWSVTIPELDVWGVLEARSSLSP